MTWAEEVGARSNVTDAAAALGMVDARGGWSPCPACGSEVRGSSDRRGPVGVRLDGRGWRCHRCRAGGDVLTLAALALTGDARPLAPGWATVRAWCAGRGWCAGAADDSAPAARPLRPAARPAPPAPRRPPAGEVAAVWSTCVGVTTDPECAAWLRSRGLDPATVEDLDLCRALPRYGARAPCWAGTSAAPWARSGHRALVPLYDSAGRLASLRARAVVTGDHASRLKGLAPSGFQVAGLVMACALARRMLEGEADGARYVRDVGVLVAEGEPDWLTLATRWGTCAALERAPAVVGVVAGSWTAEVAARVPDGARVAVWAHGDAAGEGYAVRVAETLSERCDVRRAGVAA